MLPRIAKLEFATEELATIDTVHSSFAFDFANGDFILIDGRTKKISGLDYIKTWIEKILRTRRNLEIYSSYGSGHHNLIGSVFDRDFVQAEITRTIREALLTNEAIQEISDVVVDFDGSELAASFSVSTIYGQAEVNI